jgi:hypothetical protein
LRVGREAIVRHRSAGVFGRGVRSCAAVALSLAWLIGGPQAQAPVSAASLGRVVGWGSDARGQLDPPAGLGGVILVEGGCNHSLALKSSGQVVAWGDDVYHQTEVPAAARSRVVTISAGCNHNLAMRNNHQLVAWGDNSHGQTSVPTLPKGYHWFTYSAGENFSAAIATNGSTQIGYAWGDGMDTNAVLPWKARDIEACADASVILKYDRTVYVGGKATPAMLAVPAGLRNVIAVDIGREHVVALRSNGTVVVWGSNSRGQLNVPAGLSGVKAIAAGAYHTLALKTNGQVVAWGRNDNGQSAAPPATGGLHFSALGAGTLHSLAVVQPGVPGAPTGVTVDAGNGEATVSWQPPASDGGTPITGYIVTANSGESCTTKGELRCTVPALNNGFIYTFTVKARNAAGTGPASGPSEADVPVPPTPTPRVTASHNPTEMPSPIVTPSSGATAGAGAGGADGGAAPLPLLVAAIVAAAAAAAGLAVFAVRRRGGPSRGRHATPPAPSDPGTQP